MALELSSPAFKNNEFLPNDYAYRYKNLSPVLMWKDIPNGTQSFALICDDPDASGGDWVHWVIYDIPGNIKELKERVSKKETLNNGIKQGINDFQKIGYDGPCPPKGGPHRYVFTIYVLDEKIDLKPRLTKKEVLNRIKGHILGEAKLIGLFQS